MTDARSFNAEERKKLTQIFREGSTVLSEIETLQGGLKDTISAIAEELQIKPTVLKKAIAVAHKGNFTQQADEHSMLENILGAVGKLGEGDA